MAKAAQAVSKAFGVVMLISGLTVLVIAAAQYFSTEGYTKVWPGGVLEVTDNTVITGANCTAIIAETTEERAQAISDALAGQTGDRPDTWMSWANSLRSFNITVEAVQIQSFSNNYYYSDVLLRGLAEQEKVLRLEMRPSDAIALALRSGAPIYINSTLLEEMGKDICNAPVSTPAG